MSPASNLHATALVIGDRGLLIRGQSGAGKSTLALAMMQGAAAQGRHAALVADDQVFVEIHAGRLVAAGPASIAGLVEAYGLGPTAVASRTSAVVDLVVDLVDAESAPRLQEPGRAEIAGVTASVLALEEQQTRRSCLAIAAWFGWPPFT